MLVPLIKKTWAFEKAEKIKNQFYEKFDAILAKLEAHDARLQSQEAVVASLSANDTAVLETLVYLVEHAKEVRSAQAGVEQRLAALERSVPALAAPVADLSRGVEAFAQTRATLGASVNAMEQVFADAKRVLEGEVALERQFAGGSQLTAGDAARNLRAVHTRRFALLNPEVALMVHLAPLLPTRKAIDVGASVGDVSAALITGGYEVHAFEPNPPVLAKLCQRLGDATGLVAHGVAIGAADGTMDLHLATDHSPERWYEDVTAYSSLVRHAMPPEMEFTGSIAVQVRSLDSLHREGRLPEDVSLVKIDTEGFDAEVIRGMGDRRYPVVVAEFWDEQMPMGRSGAHNALPLLAREMRARGSPWFIVIYRVFPGDENASYYCNLPEAVENSWGNVLFFRDQDLFEQARRWCASVLREAEFHKRLVPANVADATPRPPEPGAVAR